MGKMIDITGQRFGKLTVIENAGKLDGRRYSWKCHCDCGKECVVEGVRLRSGNTKSCGCGKYDGLTKHNEQQSLDAYILPETRFGKLTVVQDIGFRKQTATKSRRWYLCQCDCGNEKEVMGNMLKSGQVSSCGKCNFNSMGEFEIEQLLQKNNINYQHDIVWPELFLETGRRLRFDFIIFDEDYKTPLRFVEFDGRQHVSGPESTWSNSSSLEKIQERDNIKNQFCLSHNYKLIRIPANKLHHIQISDIMEDKYLISKEE